MIENLESIHHEVAHTEIQFDLKSLQNRSGKELIQLAENLSKGFYEKESNQRRQILQMIADKLAENSVRPL